MRIRILTALAVMTAMTATPALAKKPEMSALEMQSMQTRDYEGDKQLVFGAVMSVLQDAGYRINQGSLETGLITGVGVGKKNLTWLPFVGFGSKKKTPAVSAFIEQIGQTTKVRLTFVMAKEGSNQFGRDLGDEEPILDAQVYTDAFEKLGQAVFMRQSMAAKPAAPVAVPAPSAAPVPAGSTTK